MRKTHRCPKCDHDRVLHVTQIADRTGDVGGRVDDDHEIVQRGHYYPLRLAWIRNPEKGFFQTSGAGAGLVEAYACRACGYTELYTQGVELIEADGELVRELRAAEGEGPYR